MYHSGIFTTVAACILKCISKETCKRRQQLMRSTLKESNLQKSDPRKGGSCRNFHHSPLRWRKTFTRESGSQMSIYSLPRNCWKLSSPTSMACNALSFQKMMGCTHNSMRPYRFILWQATIGLHQVPLNSKSLFTTATTVANSTHHSLTSLLAFIGHYKQYMKMAVEVPNVQQQFGSSDCGLFAIAFTVHLAFGDDPRHIVFEQSQMQPHLLKCFQRKKM